ncbi:MAG: septal ring lytic transglycosylase RlpA family protein [Maricaulaceae bacterium]|jgi:rare lipoprotein A
MVFGRSGRAYRVQGALSRAAIAMIALTASACASGPSSSDWRAPTGLYGGSSGSSAALAAPGGGSQKIGRPYQINGVWYVPAREDNYDETGVASWYGPNFHGRPTANGETFDQNVVSAAHTTLPLPSMVRVTNLENGRSMVVRVNDRGPFVDDRIIDLSRAAARELGYERNGTARVRVQYVGPADGGERYAAAPAPEPTRVAFEPTVQQPVVRSRRPSPPAGGSDIYVQVASFRDRDRAIALMRRLGAGGPVFVNRATVNGRVWHRVMIGPWPDRQSASAARQEVARLGFGDARIVAER